jgi:hypothetical protein
MGLRDARGGWNRNVPVSQNRQGRNCKQGRGCPLLSDRKTAVRPQRTMDCLFVRTQFTVPIPDAPCCLQKVGAVIWSFFGVWRICQMDLNFRKKGLD